MSSTGEVKDAVRLAQQYNIQIYRYLIDGLVNSPLKVSQLRAELEEYTRSSMKFFVRLLEIRNSSLPLVRVREEQINVFREQMKRNDQLRQEVHNVQKGLWRLKEMGQRVPMADQHMIIQGFPELCVFTSPGKVPLTVLCDQILHKYNLRNERHIMDMLHWADEQSKARKVARQTPFPTAQVSTNPESCVEENIENDEKLLTRTDQFLKDQLLQNTEVGLNEVTPVKSWCDFSQLFPTDDGKNEVTPVPSWCDFDQLFLTNGSTNEVTPIPSCCDFDQLCPTNDSTNEMTAVPSCCEFEQDQPVTISLQEMMGQCFLKAAKELEEGKEPGSEIMAERMFVDGIKTSGKLCKETNHVENSKTFKASSNVCQEIRAAEQVREDNGLDELMSVLQDIPEIEPENTCQPALNSITQASESSEMNSAGLNITDTRLNPKNIAVTDPQQQKFTEFKDLNHFMYHEHRLNNTNRESLERIKDEPTPVTGQATVISDKEESMPEPTKPILRDLHKLKEIQSTVKESLKEVIAGIIKEKPVLDIASLPTTLPRLENRQTMHREFSQDETYKNRLSESQKTGHADESKVSVYTQKAKDIPRTLVGSDIPHVFENKIKRKQHGPSSVTQTMTAGEIIEYEKKRDEALQAVELKKQRTKLILNQQFEKSSQKSSSIHYFKVQNNPKLKSFDKPAKVLSRPTSFNTNDQICKSSRDSATMLGCNLLTPRKRPASSVSTSSAPKRARSSRPRIILRIFRDEDDWNVEQVIDRD